LFHVVSCVGEEVQVELLRNCRVIIAMLVVVILRVLSTIALVETSAPGLMCSLPSAVSAACVVVKVERFSEVQHTGTGTQSVRQRWRQRKAAMLCFVRDSLHHRVSRPGTGGYSHLHLTRTACNRQTSHTAQVELHWIQRRVQPSLLCSALPRLSLLQAIRGCRAA
jgi:hypothetical protein